MEDAELRCRVRLVDERRRATKVEWLPAIKTDASGNAVITDFTWHAMNYMVSRSGFSVLMADVPQVDPAKPMVIRCMLRSGFEVRGFVRQPDQTPVPLMAYLAEAQVTAARSIIAGRAPVADDGSFVLTDVGTGSYRLYVDADDRVARARSASPTDAAMLAAMHRPERGLWLVVTGDVGVGEVPWEGTTLRLVDAVLRVVGEIRSAVTAFRGSRTLGGSGASAEGVIVTGSIYDGQAVVEGLCEGEYKVELLDDAERVVGRARWIVVSPHETLDAWAGLYDLAVIIRGDRIERVVAVDLIARDEPGATPIRMRSAGESFFQIEELPAGEYEAQVVDADDKLLWSETLLIERSGERVVTLW